MAANAYSSPERTEAYMEHIAENHDLIMRLLAEMNDPAASMEDGVIAFAQLHRLFEGDHMRQRRLVVNLEFAAKRHKEARGAA